MVILIILAYIRIIFMFYIKQKKKRVTKFINYFNFNSYTKNKLYYNFHTIVIILTLLFTLYKLFIKNDNIFFVDYFVSTKLKILNF